MDDYVEFTDYKISSKLAVKSILKCVNLDEGKCSDAPTCLFVKENGKCKLQIPRKNLISETSNNEEIYFGRLADELIRYSRIRIFILNPRQFLSFQQMPYDLKEDEIILLEDILYGDYFEDIVPQYINPFIASKNIFDIAEPSVSIPYKENDSPLFKNPFRSLGFTPSGVYMSSNEKDQRTIFSSISSARSLLKKTDKEISSILNVYCSDTITQQGMWFNNIPFSAIPILAGNSNNEQEITYRWITNDATVTYLVAATVVDSFDNVEEASFQITPLLNNITELPSSLFNVYPIPANNNLTIEAQNNELTNLELLNVNGKLILKKEFTQSTSLDVSYIAKGMYYLNLKTDEGKLTKQIIIE
jgi:hypothetical protein